MMLEERVRDIQAKISTACNKAHRDPSQVTLLAVSKTVDLEGVAAVAQLGLTHFGENKAQEICRKARNFPELNWHFIGTLQSNKVKDVLPLIYCIHSLDRISLAEAIQKRAGEKVISCFLEVNVAEETSKAGLKLEEVIPFVKSLQAYPAIVITGLMTIAPYNPNPEASRPIFRALREKQMEIQALGLIYAPSKELSMGMSGDYTVAIEEGATVVRIGTGIFGPRNVNK
jgi:hypothetical protein